MNGVTRLPYCGKGSLTLYYSVHSKEPSGGPWSDLCDYDEFYYRRWDDGKYWDLTVYFDAFTHSDDGYLFEFDSAEIYATYLCERYSSDTYLLDDYYTDKIMPLCPTNSAEYRESVRKRLSKRTASLLLAAHKNGDQELVNALLPDFSIQEDS